MDTKAKAAWKWAGGKTQLLNLLNSRFNDLTKNKTVSSYCEPFVGAGALFWNIVAMYKFDSVYIGDLNAEMITLYKTIKDEPEKLCLALDELADNYLQYNNLNDRARVYYENRNRYNELIDEHSNGIYDGDSKIEISALFMFFNRTCFNGLYRVNKDNHFNVPHGKYKNPSISQTKQIMANSKLMNSLPSLEIAYAGYEESLDFIDDETFVYLDPPYRPLPKTPSFTAYAKSGFNDENQKELAEFCKELDKRGAKFMLSNSDPHNTDPNDDFFDDLYKGFTIERVYATRAINSKGDGRGKISEILVTNF